MKSILIENTKGIGQLNFLLPERKGVYLIVGANGSGKTTLLTCLDRICNPMAFAQGFDTSRLTREIDQYSRASITYTTDTGSVRFRKRTTRWVPTPKTGSRDLLRHFGFSDSVFIHADSRRIDINQAALRDGDFVSAAPAIKQALNTLFETNKYSRLMRLRNRNGRGRQATYFYVIRDENGYYYSEKRFSTGELALLRLVDNLQNIGANSLILLDEAEMALHPRVQVNLINYLNQIARDRDITVFISTHSPTIIKSVEKEQIIIIEESDTPGELYATTPCYAARAIGCVDFEASTMFDYIFFVEDERARSVVKHTLNRYFSFVPAQVTASTSIIPVGGFYETANMAVCTRHQVFAQSKVFAIVDQDAFEDLENKPKFRQLHAAHPDLIFGMGFTPEVFLIEQFENADRTLKDIIRRRFHAECSLITRDADYQACNAQNPRKLAKDRYDIVLDRLCSTSGDSREIVNDDLIHIIIDQMQRGDVMRFWGPIIGR